MSYIYHSNVALIPLGGFSILEACLLKKPIVCFDIEWHHELLTDGYSGYFADYANSQQICEKLLEAVNDPIEANRRGQRAYEKYLLLFDKNKIQKREEQIMIEFRESL
jgi:glycosyltransferase involved in cell wall biosynthesis